MHGLKSGDRFPVMLSSDEHFDNAHCDRALFFRHLNQAKEMNCPIILNGDFFCAMQGKWDKRASESAMRDEYRGGRYLDKLVSVATEKLAPYADNLAMIGYGNHETAIIKRHETDLTDRLVSNLRAGGSNVELGRYATWVIFRFHFNKTWISKVMFTHHGYGGSSPVTKGVIDTNRTAAYVDADIVHMGHVHNDYEVTLTRVGVNNYGNPWRRDQLHIRTPGYKDEFSEGHGWSVEKGICPKPKGARLLEFEIYSGKSKDVLIASRKMV